MRKILTVTFVSSKRFKSCKRTTSRISYQPINVRISQKSAGRNTEEVKMTQPLDVGCKEILFWKLIYAVTCSVLSQVLFLITFLFIMNFNIFHPLTWIVATFSSLTSLSTWLFLVPLGSIIFAQGVICSKDYVFESSYRTSRVLKFLGVFSIRNMVIIIFHIITGILIVWLYLNLLGGKYGTVYKNCEENNYYLVEGTFFMLLNGIWIGIFYFIKQYLKDEKSILFPVIQQNKFLTVKSSVVSKLKQAMKEAVWPTIYFVCLYFYRGVQIRDWILETFNIRLENEELTLVDTMGSMLLVYSWLFSSLFIFTMLCMKLFFEVFLTEHWMFPIETEFSHVLPLKEALGMSNIPIIQHLACLDLYMLAIWDPARRSQLFTLSQPGGHPHNWNNILQQVLKLITDFSSEINKAADAIMTPAEPLVKPKEPVNLDFQNNVTLVQKPLFDETILSSPYRSPLRNMSLPRPEPVDIVNVTQNDFFTNISDKIKLATIDKLNNIVASIKKKTGIQYFFGDLPESRIYFLLSKGQPVIWAIQGLSLIVGASFNEDKYGVVQNDLPVILTSLINLKQNLDKLNKVTVVSRKSSHSENYKMQLKIALRTAVKRSLYNICNVFGEYLGHVPLSKDVQQQIQNFVLYKEG